MTRTSLLRTMKIAAGIAVVLIVAGYAISRSFDYGRGPEISVLEPADWSSTASSTVTIKGHIERANYISLNGSPLIIDEDGNWSEIIVIFPGTNTITIDARDQFERTIRSQVHIYRQVTE